MGKRKGDTGSNERPARHGGILWAIPRWVSHAGAFVRWIAWHWLVGCPDESSVAIGWKDKNNFVGNYKCLECGAKFEARRCDHEWSYLPGGHTGWSARCKLCGELRPVSQDDPALKRAVKADPDLITVWNLRVEKHCVENGHVPHKGRRGQNRWTTCDRCKVRYEDPEWEGTAT